MKSRAATLCRTSAFEARLVHYAPGLRQADHEHERAQISFLLLGEAREIVGRKEAEVMTQACGIKPAGIRHAAEFGSNGALMLAFDFAEGAAPPPFDWSEPCQWHRVPRPFTALIGAALNGPKEDRADILWDVLAQSGENRISAKNIPDWLHQARACIADAPGQASIAGIAAEIGVHRVHFARAFQAAFGLAPSLYRSRCLTARSLSNMVEESAGLAEMAARAGFADQSHMTRAFRKHAGLNPQRLRALLA
jgi:AraC family transcriptional regulator